MNRGRRVLKQGFDVKKNITTEQRCRSERRQNQRKSFLLSFFMGRRNGLRRAYDSKIGQYVDSHEPYLMVVVTGILLLCVMDAYFTMTILSIGGEEINPLMKVLIEQDVLIFFIVKFFMTAVCLLFTVIHKHFRLFKLISGYHILFSAFFLYSILIYYELGLLARHYGINWY